MFKTGLRCAVAALLLAGLNPGMAQGRELLMLAPTNHAEPMARFEQGRLTGGILKDLGDALAERLGARPRYLALPGKRVAQAMARGEVDLLCYVLPVWIGGDHRWTRPLIDNAEIIVARAETPVLAGIEDLREVRLGSVSGYRHPVLEARLGSGFRREDAIDMRANLDKLSLDRMRYAATDRLSLHDYKRRHPEHPLHEVLEVSRFSPGCALPAQGRWRLEEIDAALRELVSEGALQRILARYGS